MIENIDVRGLACPIPVMRARQALQRLGQGKVVVIVDDATARANVTRLAQSMGWTVKVEEEGSEFHLTLTKGEG